MKNIAIVTGGSRGIGKAISIKLAENGYAIWLNYRSNDEEALKVKHRIESNGGECELIKFDVSSKEDVNKILISKINAINKKTARLSILINNAGIKKDNLFFWLTDSDWEDVINTNLNGFFYVTKAVIHNMMENKHGNIINISSVSGQIGNISQTNYSASKSGLIAATKTLSKELGRSNIRVNCVIPGLIKTDMSKDLMENKALKKEIPLKRFGEPEEIAHTIEFLCSEKASYITGSIINVTGGLY